MCRSDAPRLAVAGSENRKLSCDATPRQKFLSIFDSEELGFELSDQIRLGEMSLLHIRSSVRGLPFQWDLWDTSIQWGEERSSHVLSFCIDPDRNDIYDVSSICSTALGHNVGLRQRGLRS